MAFNIKPKSKVNIHWKVNPYDFSKDKEQEIVIKASKKYGVDKNNIKIIPEFVMLDNDGKQMSITTDVISNIQNPEFQLTLFNEYLKVNNINDYDWDLIKSIDAEINSKIDYEVYDKFRRYSIKWIKWSNFLSYGENNFFDFTNLHGLVLLNGQPANQSGKTTFAIDLIHFLLFGKTDKASTQDKIFNKHIDEATEVIVEGCLNIDGDDYVIKRTLNRPSLKKRSSKSKTTQKVEYYKVVGRDYESLEEYVDNQQEENSIQTNKVIKEAIGNESDFDMIICATSANLDELIEKKETERGRLLSRWIGLLPIEQKETVAKEKFNSDIKPRLYSNRYNKESLLQEIQILISENEKSISIIESLKNEINRINEEILKLETTKNNLMSSKIFVDKSLINIDIETLNNTIKRISDSGIIKKAELDNIIKEYDEIKDVEYSDDDYENLISIKNDIVSKLSECKVKYTSTKETISQLKNSEYCHTCGRKFENVDNSQKISELTIELEQLVEQGKALNVDLKNIDEKINKLKEIRILFDKKSKLIIKKSAIELNIEQLRNEYKDNVFKLNEYNKNNDIIDKNNKLDIEIRNTDALLSNSRDMLNDYSIQVVKNENSINNNNEYIKEREKIIQILNEEDIILKNWKIYLNMVGKNGITKMVLRKSLPIINSQIANLLSDVCDFTITIDITEKNDIVFYLLKDGVKSDLNSASGFERTASAMALRAVLSNISTLPKMNFLIADELWGRVSKDNLDNIRNLMEKILVSYDFILQISHLDEIKDWHDTIISCKKENNISKIVVEK